MRGFYFFVYICLVSQQKKHNAKSYWIAIAVLWFLCMQVFQYAIIKPAELHTQDQDKISLYVPFSNSQGNIKENNLKVGVFSDFQITHWNQLRDNKSLSSFVNSAEYCKNITAELFAQIPIFLKLRVIRR